MIHHLQSTLDRVESLLDSTIESMHKRERVDDGAVASAKGRALLALTRLSGDLHQDGLSPELKSQIARVRSKLGKEQAHLKARLDASQLVVKLIGEAIIAKESDGTYHPSRANNLPGGHAAS